MTWGVPQTRPPNVDITTHGRHVRLGMMAGRVVGFGGRDECGPYPGFLSRAKKMIPTRMCMHHAQIVPLLL